MRDSLLSALCGVLSFCLLFAPVTGHAGVISTQAYIDSAAKAETTAAFDELLQRQEVRQQLMEMGVAPADVKQRLERLSDAEIAQLHQRIDSLPAGAGVVELVGVVFVVLIILELVGVTNVFTSF